MPEKIFYTIPFHADRLTQKGRLDKSDLATSVRQNLRLLLMTPPMRVRFDPFYGCKVHWQQFLATNRALEDDKRNEDNFKTKIEENITKLIEKFEPRVQIKEVNVNIRYRQTEHTQWRLLESQRTQNTVIQLIVKIKGSVKPEYTYDGQTLDLEDTIPLL